MNDGAAAGVLLFIVFVSCFFAGLAMGAGPTRASIQKAAIEAGVAEWVIDPKTGVNEFRFIPCKVCE